MNRRDFLKWAAIGTAASSVDPVALLKPFVPPPPVSPVRIGGFMTAEQARLVSRNFARIFYEELRKSHEGQLMSYAAMEIE